jgi:probable dihydroxyacetone kinase regulator
MQQKREVKVLLAESFKGLVLEKPVEKITIKEITDGAGVIRVTFYNHFQDKYELLEWICREEIFSPARILLSSSMQREAVTFMFTAILRNKDFYSSVARTTGQNSFESIVQSLISETLTDYYVENQAGNRTLCSWLTPKWIADYYAKGLTYILMSWIEKGMSVSPEEMVDIYEYVAAHSLIDLPKGF